MVVFMVVFMGVIGDRTHQLEMDRTTFDLSDLSLRQKCRPVGDGSKDEHRPPIEKAR